MHDQDILNDALKPFRFSQIIANKHIDTGKIT